MAQVVSCRTLTVGATVRSQVISYGICGEQSGTGTRFPPNRSVFPSQYYPQMLRIHSSIAKAK
jgi:hypothetical protein